ncbi:hypothetical protein [Nitrosomonas ureae]|uniref:Uncharacterized protein n=1 Tax=Nitrosomonas ureae TaxID=44577 RepID=A0A1H2HGL0_9PROT|nr:hypothetical protein [Nitrosomonas ureae]ALQ51365.1 hypothetical protein ATY38_09145 [Nitrosomonas ureae]SDU30955.1 hypothetical protein SAMN05216406_1493 [Nitrosomonas ureae]
MSNIPNTININARKVAGLRKRKWKSLWFYSVFTRIFIMIYAIYIGLYSADILQELHLVILASTGLLSYMLTITGNAVHYNAELLKQQYEIYEAFGEEINTDLLYSEYNKLNDNDKNSALNEDKDSTYHVIQAGNGMVKFLELIRESAYFSYKLAEYTEAYIKNYSFLLLILLIVLLGGFAVLLPPTTLSVPLNKILAISCLLVSTLITLGFINIYISYQRFAVNSKFIFQEIKALLKEFKNQPEAIPLAKATKIIQAYQMARYSSPPLVDALYRKKREILNTQYQGALKD